MPRSSPTLLPGAHVVKAFNTLFASHQSDPIADGVQLDGFVAGDDAAAKATVLELVESIGLHPVDVGPLARARQLEGLAFLNITAQHRQWRHAGSPAGSSSAHRPPCRSPHDRAALTRRRTLSP